MSHLFTRAGRPTLFWGVAAFLVLTFVGLVNLTHADHYSAHTFHRAQLVWTLLGFSVAIGLMMLDLQVVRRLTPIAYAIGLILLVAVLFTDPVNQSRRWLPILGMRLQPSEPMKILTVLMLAEHLRGLRSGERLGLQGLAVPLAIVLVPAALIAVEPDLGTALVLSAIGGTVVLFHGIQMRAFMAMMGVLLLLFPVAWRTGMIRSYQKDRIRLWIAPSTVEWRKENRALLDKAIQPERARWAIGSGQMMGKGPRQGSRIRLRYLPEMHTDYIVATLAEEYGFVGCALVLLLFFAYLAWSLQVAQGARDRFGALTAAGLSAVVAVQVVVNLGMVTGLLPVVGVTLPLFSYGGSSLVVTMMGFGLLLSIARTRATL
jgi:rod shape determining protein RodA